MVKNPEREMLRKMEMWTLGENTVSGGYSLSKPFKFFGSFAKVKVSMFPNGLKQYTFFDKNNYSIFILFSSFIPKYICKEIDRLIITKNWV